MRKSITPNIKHLRHLLIALSVVVAAFAFDGFYDSLNISWSAQVEDMLRHEKQQEEQSSAQKIQPCVVSASPSFKLTPNYQQLNDKLFQFAQQKLFYALAFDHKDALKFSQNISSDGSLASFHFLDFTCYHQSSSDDDASPSA